MKTKLKMWYSKNKNNINTMKFIFISSILLFLIWLVDIRYPDIKRYLPHFILLPKDLSKAFLSTLAGVFLTVATFAFTTILTVLWNYASNYTPRVMQKFIDKPNILSLIGIFIGGFFYSVLSLFFINQVNENETILAGSLGVFYATSSMIYFLRFIQQVLRDTKASNLIQDIYDQTLILVEEEAEKRKASEKLPEKKIKTQIKICAQETGFLYGVDYNKLFTLVKNLNGELIIDAKIGEYICRGLYIARLSLQEEPPEEILNEKTWMEDLEKCFLFNFQKNDTYDYHQEITNMVEIALRAISPGINDPNTAINCINKISSLLGKLFSSRNHFIITKENKNMRVIYTAYTVKEELYLTFHQIINFGKDSPSVAYAILEGLLMIYMISDDSADNEIKDFFNYAYSLIEPNMVGQLDLERIEDIKKAFFQQTENSANKEVIQNKR